MTEPTSKRRWFRFSLWTLFAVVTVLCVWFGYHLNWIRERHQFLKAQQALTDFAQPIRDARTSRSLCLLGERGVGILGVLIVVERLDEYEEGFDWESHATMREARRLFPEAEFSFGVMERAQLEKLPRREVAPILNRSNAR